MTTISSPPPAGKPAPGVAVPQPASVEAARDRSGKSKRSNTPNKRDGATANDREFSDEVLLNVLRAFGGKRGVIVDKSV